MTVFVRGLRLQAAIGVHAHEQGRLQTLVLDVELQLAGTGRVESLADTFDYEGVAEAARALVAGGHIGLVETLAQDLAAALLEDPRVQSVSVTVAKPGALEGAEAAGCVVRRSR